MKFDWSLLLKKMTRWDLLSLAQMVLIPLIVIAVFSFASGVSPVLAYQAFFHGALGSVYAIADTLIKTTPLLLAGLGVAIAFKCGVWNIGAEGQLYIGALAATLTCFALPQLHPFFLIPLVILVAFLGGALWAGIPGLLKVRLGANEVIITLMMNFVAILFVRYMVYGPLTDPISPFGWSKVIPPAARLPIILPASGLHAGILVGFISLVLVYFILSRTVLGYEIKAVGSDPTAASFSGMNMTKIVLIVMLISGGLAGIAGMSEVFGLQYRLTDRFSPGYGYLAIAVALVGKLNPIGVLFSSVLFASLLTGMYSMQRMFAMPFTMVYVIESLIILSILCTEILMRRRQK